VLFVVCTVIQFGCINKDTPTGTGVLQADSIQLYSGNYQSGTIETRTAKPLVVRILASNLQPVANVFVGFSTSYGKATFSESLPKTDENGFAQTYCIFGTLADTITVFAVCQGVKGSPAVFKLHSLPSNATSINLIEPLATQVTAGTGAAVQLLVTDTRNNPVPNVVVHFQMTKGIGSFTSASLLTDTLGKVKNTWLVDTLAGKLEAAASFGGVNAASVTLQTTVVPDEPAKVVIMDGNAQACFVETTAPVRLTANVIDKYGNYRSNVGNMGFVCTTTKFASLGKVVIDNNLFPARGSVTATMTSSPGEIHVLATLAPAGPAEFVLHSYSLVALAPLNIDSNGIWLQWTQTSDPGFLSYKIFRSTSPNVTPGSTLIAAITDRNTSSYVDANITRGTGTYYYYSVQIAFANGDALFTNEQYIIP
jgi:hypothetical protein